MQKLKRYYVYILTGITAVFAAVLVSHIIVYIISKPIPLLKPASSGQTSMPAGQLMLAVTERNMFNIEKEIAPEDLPTPGQTTAPLSQESFNGKLTGVIMGSDLQNSFAILVTSANEVHVLRGGKATSGYQLKQIDIKSAVVEYSGREYALQLEENTPAATPPPAQTRPTPVPPPVMPSTPAAEATDGGTTLVSISRSDLIEQLKDQNALVRDTALAAYYEDGKNAGYRITRLGDNAPIKILGFERGDIIKRINGEDITSNPQSIFELAGKVGEIDAVSIDIIRNNERKTIFVEVQ